MNRETHEPDEREIHAYVDGRLGDLRRRAVEAWMAENPARAAEILAWQQDAQQLRAVLGDPAGPADNPALHPARVRAGLRARRRRFVGMAAMLLIATGLGGAAGWQAHAWRGPGAEPPMADALQAFRLFAPPGALRPDFTPRDAVELQVWLDHHFARAPHLPDLAAAGFRPEGARLLATAEGPAAMVLYRDARGSAISFYVRPPSPRGALPRGERRDGALLVQYGSGTQYLYALVSRADSRDAEIARQALPNTI